MELAELPNPYDFANPVADPDRFAGRQEELRTIEYYLDHCQASRPIGLALLGPRAAGKTSLLNMLEIQAGKRGFCVARVDLDESDALSSSRFFFRILDELVTTAVEVHNAFNGPEGSTYEAYLNMVLAQEVPATKLSCPLRFPMQYAKAAESGVVDAVDLDSAFRRDLRRIQDELSQPLAILLDECDVLMANRAILQKLRNISSRDGAPMIVVCGTTALLEQINDVFSPALRGFKVLKVEGFSEPRDTRECISKPLRSIGIHKPEAIMPFETYQDLLQVHRLTGGTPYEIQLLCHTLFRRVQTGKSSQMELSVEALDAVMVELREAEGSAGKWWMSTLPEMSEESLITLLMTSVCEDGATVDQLWFWEYLLHGETRCKRNEFRETARDLCERGLLVEEDDGRVQFTGTATERLYLKYFARGQGVNLPVGQRTFMAALAVDFWTHLLEILPEASGLFMPRSELDRIRDATETPIEDLFTGVPHLAVAYYWACFDYRRTSDAVQYLIVSLTTPWGVFAQSFFCGDLATECPARMQLSAICNRAEELQGQGVIEARELPLVSHVALAEQLVASGDSEVLDRLLRDHRNRLLGAYSEVPPDPIVVEHAEMAAFLNPSIGTHNDLGYVKLAVVDDRVGARAALERAIAAPDEQSATPLELALPNYNLAVLDALEGDIAGARKRLERVEERIEGLETSQRECAWLLALQLDGMRIGVVERSAPDILDVVAESKEVLSQLP